MLAVAVKRANPPAPVLLQFSKLELPLPSSSASLGRMDVVVEVILCHLASFLEDGVASPLVLSHPPHPPYSP